MLRCIGNSILVQEVKSETEELCEKIGNLVIPAGQTEYDTVKVLSVGEGITAKISEGDQLLVYPGCGKKIHHEGTEYRVINISEIIAVK